MTQEFHSIHSSGQLPHLVKPDRATNDLAAMTSGFTSRKLGNVSMREAALWFTLKEIMSGNRKAEIELQEAMSTSDFPLLYGDIIQREMLQRFQALTPAWNQYARTGFVSDFRQARRLAYDGIDGVFYPSGLTPELTAHNQDNALTETGYIAQVAVYSKGFGYSWQMTVGDVLNMLGELPGLLGVAARRSEEYLATSLLVDAGGPITPFFSAGNNNLITGNPPLSIAGLETGLSVVAQQTDRNGEPIMFDNMALVVPRSLQVTARQILNATALEKLEGSTGTVPAGTHRYLTPNWLNDNVILVVNPYLDIINLVNGTTAWFLIGNPRLTRPALEVTKLTGFDQPRVYRKMSNMTQVGSTSPEMGMGDFDTLRQEYKVIYPLGGTRLDPRSAFVSNGV